MKELIINFLILTSILGLAIVWIASVFIFILTLGASISGAIGFGYPIIAFIVMALVSSLAVELSVKYGF